MSEEIQGKRVAFLVANEGIEQVELTEPWKAVEQAGGEPVLIAPEPGEAQAFNHLDKADTFAGVVDGRTLTSWPSLQTDIRNAGGEWVDEEVHVDSGLVTSRNPDDLEAFCAKTIEEIAEGVHDEQREATVAS
jgi:putative intracellular protease/amidase